MKKENDNDLKDALSEKQYVTEAFEELYLTCGNCQLICWGDPEETRKNYYLLINSGCVVMNKIDSIDVISPNTSESMNLQDNQIKCDETQEKFAKLVEVILRKNEKN